MKVTTGGTYAAGFTYTAANDAVIVFSCGCTTQAGTATTSNTGAFTLVADSTPTPSVPAPTYTIVPGRNYIVVAAAGAGGSGPEGWDIQFAGRSPNRDHYLNGTNLSDVYTAAVSLYVYDNSPGNGETAYDDWNFNTLVAWYNVLTSSPDQYETKLLNDIASQSAANNTLYPSAPLWNPDHATNSTINTDLSAVQKNSAVPTPCPSTGCTGAPIP